MPTVPLEFVPMGDEPQHDTSEGEGALDHAVLRRRARLGVLWLLLRTVFLQLAVAGATVVLARVLEPAEFGVFAIAQFAMAFFLFLGDAGLGGALIQKQGTPTQRELSSVFIVQVVIAACFFVFVLAGAGLMRVIWSDLPSGAEWVFRALSVGLLLTVLRVIPTILMERQLLFGRLSIIEVLGTLGFYGGAMGFAVAGYGVWALVIGTLLQGAISTGLAVAMRPWRPSLVFDREALRPILRFGIPFQAKNLISFFNGAITPIYAGGALGANALGFIQWAQTTAYFPLKLVSIMGRVTFPLYSRLADDKEAFAETLGRSLQICAFGTFFFVGLFLGMSRQVIHVIFSDKWMPAEPLLHIYASAITIGFISPVAAAALDAAGKPQIIAKLALGWTTLNWIVVLIATPRWGMVGFAAGYSVHVVVGNIAVLVMMMRVIPGVRVARRVAAPVIAGIAVYFFGRWAGPHAMTPLSFAGSCAGAFVLYAAVVVALDWRGVKNAIAIVPKKEEPQPESS